MRAAARSIVQNCAALTPEYELPGSRMGSPSKTVSPALATWVFNERRDSMHFYYKKMFIWAQAVFTRLAESNSYSNFAGK